MNNPQAFPVQGTIRKTEMDREEVVNFQSGMTIRDYFAGQVLTSIGSQIMDDYEIAEICYGLADAMLKERSKHE